MKKSSIVIAIAMIATFVLVGCAGSEASQRTGTLVARAEYALDPNYGGSEAPLVLSAPAPRVPQAAPPGLGLVVDNETLGLVEVTGDLDPVRCSPDRSFCEDLVVRPVLDRGASSPRMALLLPPKGKALFRLRRGGDGIQVIFTGYAQTEPATAQARYVKTYDGVGLRRLDPARVRCLLSFTTGMCQ
jgi:hypothetical protein